MRSAEANLYGPFPLMTVMKDDIFEALDEVREAYGHGSEQHLAVKRVFNALYDDYFGYRYLY